MYNKSDFKLKNIKNVDIVYKIFKNKIYYDPDLLANEISNIQDNVLVHGLMVDLIAKSEEYRIDKDTISFLLFDYGKKVNENIINTHQYYINILSNDEKSIFIDFLLNSSEDGLNDNEIFIEFIKKISSNGLKRITKYCIDNEYYDIVEFILKLKKYDRES
jgi:hypothetical protein